MMVWQRGNGEPIELTPALMFWITIALIVAAVVMEVSGNEDTVTIMTVLVGLLGLQQHRQSRAVEKIEKQNNGALSAHMGDVKTSISGIVAMIEALNARIEDGDRTRTLIHDRQNSILEQQHDYTVKVDEMLAHSQEYADYLKTVDMILAKQQEYIAKVDELIAQVGAMEKCEICGRRSGIADSGNSNSGS